MEFLAEYGLFLAKTLTLVIAILVIIAAIAGAILRQKHSQEDRIDVKKLNSHYQHMATSLKSAILSKQSFKQDQKAEKKKAKQLDKAGDEDKKRVYVMHFDGDIKASPVESLREEISAVLTSASDKDEVVLKLESGGGMVHGYGLAASQLQRIRDREIPLTVCVDKIAASGGYMMACVANRIISAPFAIIGSIGVLAQIPNFNRMLKDKNIDFEQFKGGDYKRTVTLFGETTDEDRAKMQSEIDQTHVLFKRFVKQQRPALDIEKVANGDHWFGAEAIDLGLVDALQTSDDYLMSLADTADIFEIAYHAKKSLKDRVPFLQAWFGRATNMDLNQTHLHLR